MSLDIKTFSLKESWNNAKGQSSAGLFVASLYGLSLIVLVIVAALLYFIGSKVISELNNIFLFVGSQMPIVLTYLGVHKNLDNNDKGTTTTTT